MVAADVSAPDGPIEREGKIDERPAVRRLTGAGRCECDRERKRPDRRVLRDGGKIIENERPAKTIGPCRECSGSKQRSGNEDSGAARVRGRTHDFALGTHHE